LKFNICAAVGAAAVAEDDNAASKRPLVNQLLVIPGSFRVGFPVETDFPIFGTSNAGSSTILVRADPTPSPAYSYLRRETMFARVK
jgi:hypothetical protein